MPGAPRRRSVPLVNHGVAARTGESPAVSRMIARTRSRSTSRTVVIVEAGKAWPAVKDLLRRVVVMLHPFGAAGPDSQPECW